jgi:hypothetical protein
MQMRRFLGFSIAAAVVALAVGVPMAAADEPFITHVRVQAVNEEASAELSEFCGFEIVVFEDVRATERDYPDGSERDTVNERITYTAGDQQLFEHNTFQFYFDADEEIERYTGVPFRVVDESGRVIFKDRGNVAFDRETREIVWEHGPHPSLHDTSGRSICDDLSE